jgi:serine protease Do
LKIPILTRIQHAVLRPVLASVLAIALAGGGFATYELTRPQNASAANPAPPAAALPADQVTPILSLDQAMENLTSRVTPAVVNVVVTSRSKAQSMNMPDDMQNFFGQFFGQQFPHQFQQQPRTQVEHGEGSGFVISPDGYIVTNNHVVEGATDIRVTLSNQETMPAKLIGTDPLTDLAVIKVNQANLASIPWGDSTELKAGQTVLAFGNPFGMKFTVTRGIISGINRANPFSDNPRKPGEFIQTDAAINPGNSGGPLVDARGQVVGINTFLISDTGAFAGMGFAIPTQVAKPVVDQLIRTGKVEHGYMGITIEPVTPENAKFFNLQKAEGALVSGVEPDTPGARAGLKSGDVIVSLDGKPVQSSGQLQVMVEELPPGTKIQLSVMRNGQQKQIPLTLGSYNKGAEENASATSNGKPRWGVGISNLTPDVRQQLNIPSSVQGAVVGNVVPGSPADNAGLSQGDVIEQVNRQDTPNADAVKNALANVPAGQDVLVLVWSHGGATYRVMHAAEAQNNQSPS